MRWEASIGHGVDEEGPRELFTRRRQAACLIATLWPGSEDVAY